MSWSDILSAFMRGFDWVQKKEDSFEHVWERIEARLEDFQWRMKRYVYRIVAEIVLVAVAVLCLLAGIILFLSRYARTEYVLLGAGLILLYTALMVRMMRR